MNKFYKLYHGNLAFSSIEEKDLGEVIDKTYFPLLDLIDKTNTKIAIELNGYSLEKIKQLRPKWINKFKLLYTKGLVEFVGSGYMQIISPMVPYEINLANQKIGLETYKTILGFTPTIVYVNEQVFSNSLVDIYVNVGYKAIMMEWNNAYSTHKVKWKKEFAFQPIIVRGIRETIPLIWTDTILFQQFQRVVYNDVGIDEYINIIKRFISIGYKALPVYSSDLEIFNYRPGRFKDETNIEYDEWLEIFKILKSLKNLGRFYLPSEILKFIDNSIKLDLTNAINPILVKKQDKYSLSRWSACGRGSNYINTLCFNYFKQKGIDKSLLQFWGSDYRTHTTKLKWDKAINYLTNNIHNKKECLFYSKENIIKKEDKLIFNKDDYEFVFNLKKGLSLEKVSKDNELLSFGSVKHGDLDYIYHGADFYTGVSVIEAVHTKKITDLSKIVDYKFHKISQNKYQLSTNIDMQEAIEYKEWIIDLENLKLILNIKMRINRFINGYIRLGTLTLLPQLKDSNFWYECKNGGEDYERFMIDKNVDIEHHYSKSLLQSSNNGIGVTNGILRFGINKDILCEIEIDKEVSYPFVMLQNSIDHDKYLTRVFFSVQELDDTLVDNNIKEYQLKYSINLKR